MENSVTELEHADGPSAPANGSATSDTPCTVLEEHDDDGVHWGLSFAGPTPTDADYFPMADRETAFRLAERINCMRPSFEGRTTPGSM